MIAKPLPNFNDLQLDAHLRQAIEEEGAKVGVLHWIREQLPHSTIPEHLYLPKIQFKTIKKAAKIEKNPIIVRSNNICEYLPGTEGLFESVRVYDFDGPSDMINFRALRELPRCPAQHLLPYWPKKNKMKYATTPAIQDGLFVNMIEHPNIQDVFWYTLTADNQTKQTHFSDEPEFWRHHDHTNKRFGDVKTKTLEKMLTTAKEVAALPGLDARYTKQMEFVLNQDTAYLTQVKILVQKKPASQPPPPEIDSRLRHRLFRTFGIFDEKLRICNLESLKQISSQEKIAYVMEDPSSIPQKGEWYQPNREIAIFQNGQGMLMHKDIPYFIYTKGTAIGNRSAYALDLGTSKPVFLDRFIGKKVRLKSDGHYLYVAEV